MSFSITDQQRVLWDWDKRFCEMYHVCMGGVFTVIADTSMSFLDDLGIVGHLNNTELTTLNQKYIHIKFSGRIITWSHKQIKSQSLEFVELEEAGLSSCYTSHQDVGYISVSAMSRIYQSVSGRSSTQTRCKLCVIWLWDVGRNFVYNCFFNFNQL